MFKMIAIPFLILALFAILSFNQLCTVVGSCYRWLIRNITCCFSAIPVLAMFILSGCSTGDMSASMQLSRLGLNSTVVVKAWSADRKILEKYRDLLPESSQDRQALDKILSGGDGIQKELSILLAGGRVPSVEGLKLLLDEADIAVIAGSELYRKYIEHIGFTDRMRANEFGIVWSQIKNDLAGLTEKASQDKRYETAKEILSFMLTFTGQVVIPAMRASGKL